jgi:putative DNA primase/helicase
MTADKTAALIDLAWANLRKANPELPAQYKLTANHASQLAASDITIQQAVMAGIFSATAAQSLSLIGYNDSGLMFPYFDVSGRLYTYTAPDGSIKPFCRLRPDKDSKSKGAKYLSPAGAGCRVYIPRTADFKWADDKGGFRSRLDVVITEGEKKALAATLKGTPCLGLGGVNSYSTGPKDSENAIDKLGFFIQEFNLLAQKRVTVTFDGDIATNTNIQEAIKSFVYTVAEAYTAKELADNPGLAVINRTQKLGDILKYTLLPQLPNKEKVGLDDAFVKWGRDAVQELLDSAMPLCKVDRSKDDPKDIYVTQLFCAEPLGDGASRKLSPVHLQAHNRSLLAWLCLNQTYAISPTIGYLQYQADLGVWQKITKQEWATLPERAADLNGWANRGLGLMTQHQKFCEKRLTVNPGLFNTNRLLGFTNGALNVDTRELLPHSSANHLTQRLGFSYNPKANCDNWLNWLMWTFAEQMPDGSFRDHGNMVIRCNLVRALMRWTLEPKDNTPFLIEVFPYLIGLPGLGKGTFLEILKALAGEAAGHWDLRKICDPNGRASFAGKLVAIDPDLKGSLKPESASAINQITSNEEVAIKLLYRNACSARCNTVLWAASNNSIMSDTTDRHGVDRRLVYLEFKRKPEERDPTLKSRLLAELPGIFNWVFNLPLDEAIDTIKQYRQGSLSLEAQKTALTESNSVYQWIIDTNYPALICPTEVETRRDILCDLYTQWCSRTGTTPLKQRNFTRELVKAGAAVRTNPYYAYTIPHPSNISISGMMGL